MHLLSSMRGGLVVLALGISLVSHAAELPELIDLSVEDATPVLRIYSRNAGDYLGSENGNGIAFGDVNGDGFDDTIMGAYVADPRLPQATDTGVVYVIYGGATRPNTTVNLALPADRRRITQVYGDDPRDSAGYSVSSGDINGDGFDDILVGALFADRVGSTSATTEYDTGKAYVIYGSNKSPGRIYDLSEPAGTYDETRILGRSGLPEQASLTPGDLAGWSIGSGDINADGFDDVIVGARAADPDSRSDAGEVYVVYGSASIESTTVDLRDTPATNTMVRIKGGQAGGFLGWSLASGDANGDGFDDLFLGAYTGSVASVTTGITYVIYGGTAVGPTIDLSVKPSSVTQINGDNERDHLGWSMGAGDVNADGYDDVVIGAVGVDGVNKTNVGGVYVVYGKSTLPGMTINLAAYSTTTATLVRGAKTSDQLGWSAAASDVNGDGLDDVIIGAIGLDGTAGEDTGGLILVPGNLLKDTALVDLSYATGTIKVTGEGTFDLLGYGGEAGGDANRDGFADFAGSAIYGDNPSLISDNDSGSAYVVFGDGTAQVASFKESFRSGVAPRRGIGGRLSPVARVWLEFNSGNESLATVTLTRTKDAISGFDDPNKHDVASAMWKIESDRTGFSKATVTIQYLDSEKIGMNERGLTLFHASSPSGPWFEVASQVLDLDRNEVVAGISASEFNSLIYYTFSPRNADLPSIIDLDVPPGEEASPVARIYGDNENDLLGSSHGNGIAFGDINGDGYDDVILGATGSDPGGRTNAGGVYILYGTSTLLTKTVDLNQPAGYYGETRILGANNENQAGYAVACGDVNADGFDDAIIGIPRSDASGRTDAGEVQVIYGSPILPDTTLELSDITSSAHRFRVYGARTGDNAGFSVATGDINGDAKDDVLIGAPFAGQDVGAAYVIYGSTATTAVIDLSDATGTYGETRILGDDNGDRLGYSIASGEVNGDGIEDILLGATGGSPDNKANAGETYVIPGSSAKPGLPTLTGSVVDLDTNGAISSTGDEVRILGEIAGDRSGCSVAAGDINRDGYDDVIIGALYATAGGRTGAGKGYVVYGSDVFEAASVNLSSTTHAVTRFYGGTTADLMGVSVSSGDINGDGFEDVVLGAIQADPPGGINAGEVYVMYGSTSLPNALIDSITDMASVSVWGDNASDLLGYGAESGADVDSNGFADFIASARRGDNPNFTPTDNDAGLAALIFGDGSAKSAGSMEWFQADTIGVRGMGGRLSPVVRTWMGFEASTGSSAIVASATVTRSDSAITNLGDGTRNDLADVYWQVVCNHPGSPTATLVFQYLDSEVDNLFEPGLRLYHATSLAGPWSDIPIQILNPHRNTITAKINSSTLGFFAIRLPQEIEFVDTPLLYGKQRMGCDEATKTLTIWNRGMADLTFSAISIIGPASADFTIVSSTPALLATLAPDATKEISIAFLPTATGTRTAYLQVLSNDPDEADARILLEGEGIYQYLEIIPDYVDFGAVEIGPPDRSATRTVTLRSMGDTPFEFSRLTILGDASPEYSIIDPVTGTMNPLDPGQQRVLTIRFNPSSLRVRSATLVANASPYSSLCPQATAEAILSGTGTGDAPEIEVIPRRLNFGRRDLCEGMSPAMTLRISNIGTQPLVFTGVGITKTGADHPDFIILTDITSLVSTPIPAGASRTLEVAFQPTELGNRSARLVITTNDGDEATLIVPLSGRGEETNITITPDSEELDFGDVAVCRNESATRTLTIHNDENRALNFTGEGFFFEGPAASEYTIVSPTGDALIRPLAANGSRTLVVTFDPDLPSLRRARLVMTTDDCHRPTVRIRLYGRGNSPHVEVTPTQLDFGSWDIDAGQSATQTVYIHNSGNYFLNFTGDGYKFLGEASAEFVVVSPTSTLLAPLQAGTTREMVIAFNPSSLRIRSATLAITTDDCEEATSSVILSGTGTGLAPEIEVLPKSLNFGNWNIRSGDTLSQGLIIHNIGTLPLTFNPPGIWRDGPQASEFVVLNATGGITATAIPPDGTRELYIAFNPEGLGERRGTLYITTNDGDEPVVLVRMTGNGVDPDIEVSPDELLFGALDVCGTSSATETVTIHNYGQGPLSFTGAGIVFTGVGAADYHIVSPTTGATADLPEGETRILVVAFDPVSYGRRKAQMLILTNDYDESTVSVTLSGRGLGPEIEIIPSDLQMDFGPVSVCGDTYASQSFTIRNRGNQPLEFEGPGISFEGSASNDFYILSPTTDAYADIPAGTSRVFEVAFDPSIKTRRRARMVIYTSDCDESRISVPLEGRGAASEIEILPADLELNFGLVSVCGNTYESQFFTIQNKGHLSLEFEGTGIDFVGSASHDFYIVSPTMDAYAAIPAGASRVFEVAFDPSIKSRRKAQMMIYTNDCDESVIAVPLQGRGAAPEIEILPADLEINFGEVPVCGNDYANQSFIIENTGNMPLEFVGEGIGFTGSASHDFYILSPTTDAYADIPVGTSRVFEVAFDPTIRNRRKAQMMIYTNDCDESVIAIPLEGRGAAPEIEILPVDLEMDFGDVSVCGDTYTSLSFTILNEGNIPLEFVGTGIGFEGNASHDFYILSPTMDAYAAIPAGTSRVFEVAFDPTLKNRRKAQMVIYTDDCDESRISIPLSGHGKSPEIDISSDQLELNFDNTYTCSVSAPTLTVTIRNRGNEPLSFTGGGISFTLDDYSIAQPVLNATADIEPYQERDIVVAFAPTSPGRKKGTMLLTTDDCDEGVIEIPLSGFGLGPDITVTPANIDFGTWSVSGGVSATRTVTIHNTGNRTLNFTSIAITGSHLTDFSLVSPTTGLTDPLTGLQSRVLSLGFDPTGEGTRNAILTITSDDCDEPVVQIPLTGTGSLPKEGEAIAQEGTRQNGTSGVEGWGGYE